MHGFKGKFARNSHISSENLWLRTTFANPTGLKERLLYEKYVDSLLRGNGQWQCQDSFAQPMFVLNEKKTWSALDFPSPLGKKC